MALGDYIIPGAQAVTQRGIGFINACGEAALAVVQAISHGVAPTTSQVTSLARQGAQFGTAPSGTSTIAELQKLSAATGTQLVAGSGADTLNTINANLSQGLPTEVGINKAYVFGGADSRVNGHYVTVVGKAANGNYIVADPNQPAALSGGFVQYSPSQFLKAAPFGTLTPNGLGNAASGFTSSAISQGIQGALGGAAQSIGASGLNDFVWRAVLIGGGLTLMVIGVLVFFSHQEEQAVTVIGQQAGNAAKVAAVAA